MEDPNRERRALSVAEIRHAATTGSAALLCPPAHLATPLAVLVAEAWPDKYPIRLLKPHDRAEDALPDWFLEARSVEEIGLPASTLAEICAAHRIDTVITAEQPGNGALIWIAPLAGWDDAALAALRREALRKSAAPDGPDMAETVMVRLRQLGYL